MCGAPLPTTAPGRTDIGGHEEPVVDRAELLDVLRLLTGRPTPHGEELASARAVQGWIAEHLPEVSAVVHPAGSTANLVCSVGSGPELVLYSHLDTSLTGHGDRDGGVTGHDDDAPLGLEENGDLVSGFGVGVARGPASAAVAAFAAAARATADRHRRGRLTLLLAGGGTHRDGTGEHGAGVRRFLEGRPRPAAAIVAKGGPDGVLYAEPGAVYLRVRVGTRRGVVLAREHATPPGGLVVHAGTVIAAIERWRAEVVLAPGAATGPTAREAGIGALHSGSPAKPDLLPAVLDIHLYLVTLPGDDVVELVDALRRVLHDDLAASPLAECTVEVTAGPHQRGGGTSPTAPIAVRTRAAWMRHSRGRMPSEVLGWRGSTDGTVFREHGIATVRTGPAAAPDPADSDRDSVAAGELVRYARIYAQVGAHWLTDPDREG